MALIYALRALDEHINPKKSGNIMFKWFIMDIMFIRTNKNMAAREAKNHFGQLLDAAQKNPVMIEKKGRVVAVVISIDEYQHLQRYLVKPHEEVNFKAWIGFAKHLPPNRRPKFRSDDDLWKEG